MKNLFTPVSDTDPIRLAKRALQAARQYQKDWVKHGSDRVYKYFDDVDGNWLENWEEGDRNDSSPN